MKKALIFIVGVLVGLALYAGGESYFAKPAPVADPADANAIKEARSILAHEQERTAALDKREMDLKLAAAKQDMDENTPNATAKPANPFMNPTAIKKVAAAMMQQQATQKLAALKLRLNLTDDQTQAVQDLMDKQAQVQQEQMDAGMNAMLTGKMSKDDMAKMRDDAKSAQTDFDAGLQSILTPDQSADYQAYQSDVKKSANETRANTELSQIQSTLQLSDDQKDKVFTVLYQQDAQPANGSAEDQLAARKAAMQNVLTPDQFEAYSNYLDAQKKAQDSMRAAFGLPADAPMGTPPPGN